MKKLLLVFLILLINSGCKGTQDNQDRSCRETIQKLYSLESYCPDNLIALQQLFTEEFNQQYKPSLDRCTEINEYTITKLLSSNDNDFPSTNYETNTPNVLIYYIEVKIESKSGIPLGNVPSPAWIHMKINEINQCQIDEITGGG